MTSREISIGGVTYVRSRHAAQCVNLSPAYISRLARSGLVAGKLADGLWFVSLASLKDFIAEQEQHKEVWRAQLAKLRREEQRLAGHPSALAA